MIQNGLNVVQREFDTLAGEYETNRLAGWYKAHAEEILRHCPNTLNGDILDVGCGTGYLLRLLSAKYPGAGAVGMDISPNMIAEASSKSPSGGQELCLMTDNWEQPESGNFDKLTQRDFGLIVCANAFHYFQNPLAAIQRMRRLLAPGGILLVLEREKSASLMTSLWGLAHRHLIKDQVEFYATDEILDFFTQAGFDDARVVSTIRKYFWKGKLFTSIALIKATKPDRESSRQDKNH